MTTNGRSPHTAELEALVAELLVCGGMLAQIIDHMARFHASGRSDPEAPPFDVILNGLLCDVLGDLPRSHGTSELQAATAILKDTATAMSEEILLVDPDELEEIGPAD